MSDDENTPKNSISQETPFSRKPPRAYRAYTCENTAHSQSTEVPSEALEIIELPH